MTAFAYTTGDPANLTGGASANMADIKGPFDDLEVFLSSASIDEANLTVALLQKLGLTQGAQVGGGVFEEAVAGTRTDTTYGSLTNGPDQVASVDLPTSGLILVVYQATWKESVNGAATAGLFLGGSQVVRQSQTATTTVETTLGGGNADRYVPLFTAPNLAKGMGTGTTALGAYSGDVTTGMMVGGGLNITDAGGGVAVLVAAAGSYNVSVQFKASSGTVTVKDRHLWVWTRAF